MSLAKVLKHLPGKHNQKRHAWRYGAGSEATLSKIMGDATQSVFDEREFQFRVLMGGIKGMDSHTLAKALHDMKEQEHRTKLAAAWLRANATKVEPYKKHGMSEPENKALTVNYKAQCLLRYPNTTEGKLAVARTIALWEAPPIHNDEATTIPYNLAKHTRAINFTSQRNSQDEHCLNFRNKTSWKVY